MYLDDLLPKDDDLISYHLCQSHRHLKDGYFSAALDSLERAEAYKLRPYEEALIHKLRSDAFQIMQEYDDAINSLDKAIDTMEKNAIQIINSAQDQNIEKKLEAFFAFCHYERGSAHHAIKQYENAIMDFDRADDLGLTSPPMYMMKAEASLHLGKYDEALDSLDQAMEFYNNHPEYWHTKALILINMGREESAGPCIEIALELNPNYSEAIGLKGILLLRLAENSKEEKEAISLMTKAIEKGASNQGELLYNRHLANTQLSELESSIGLKLQRQYFEDADSDKKKLLDIDPKYAMQHFPLEFN